MRRPLPSSSRWPLRASTIGLEPVMELRYRNADGAGQHTHLEGQAAEWLAIEVHPGLGVSLDPQPANRHDLHPRVVHVAGLVDAGQLAQRLEAGKVAHDADVQPAVIRAGTRTDLHPAAIERAVGKRDEEAALLDQPVGAI